MGVSQLLTCYCATRNSEAPCIPISLWSQHDICSMFLIFIGIPSASWCMGCCHSQEGVVINTSWVWKIPAKISHKYHHRVHLKLPLASADYISTSTNILKSVDYEGYIYIYYYISTMFKKNLNKLLIIIYFVLNLFVVISNKSNQKKKRATLFALFAPHIFDKCHYLYIF